MPSRNFWSQISKGHASFSRESWAFRWYSVTATLPTMRRWGAKNFVVKDPDGNLLLFAGPGNWLSAEALPIPLQVPAKIIEDTDSSRERHAANRSTSRRPEDAGTGRDAQPRSRRAPFPRPPLSLLAGRGVRFVYPFLGVGRFGPFAGDLSCGDVEAVPDVGHGHVQEDGGQLRIVVVA